MAGKISAFLLIFNDGSLRLKLLTTDHTFYGFTSMITHTGCWENARSVWASGLQAFRVVLYCFCNVK